MGEMNQILEIYLYLSFQNFIMARLLYRRKPAPELSFPVEDFRERLS
jgi:hypothetical protein